jgi:biotin carboxylase
MNRALLEVKIDGIETTRLFQRNLINTPEFRAGQVHTRFVQDSFLNQSSK